MCSVLLMFLVFVLTLAFYFLIFVLMFGCLLRGGSRTRPTSKKMAADEAGQSMRYRRAALVVVLYQSSHLLPLETYGRLSANHLASVVEAAGWGRLDRGWLFFVGLED